MIYKMVEDSWDDRIKNYTLSFRDIMVITFHCLHIFWDVLSLELYALLCGGSWARYKKDRIIHVLVRKDFKDNNWN